MFTFPDHDSKNGCHVKEHARYLELKKFGVNFTLHSYDYDGADAERVGLQAAKAIGVRPQRILKTFMAEVDHEPVGVIVPSDREVSMKKWLRHSTAGVQG